MAVIKKDGNFMGLPMNIARGNPIPLDRSEIWYSQAEMEEYAKLSPVAYPGQMLSLVDEESQTSTAYIIVNVAGDLQKIGTSTINADNSSLIVDKETISLYNWNKQYYKYVPATETEKAHFATQIVDEEHPWKSGLEPRVISENGKLTLGWYEPDPSTIEGINTSIVEITSSLQDLQKNTYTKTEIDKKLADADHLKRIIVNSRDDIDVNAPNADQYIYMVLTSPEDEDDKYDEYMVIAYIDAGGEKIRYLEKVGSWKVDLASYVTKDSLATELDKKISIQEGFGLISIADLNKLSQIQAEAEKNVINDVDSTNFTVTDRKLFLNNISVNQVANLQSILDDKVTKEEGKGLSSNDFTLAYMQAIQNNTQNISIITNQVTSLETILSGNNEDIGLVEKVRVLNIGFENQKDTLEDQQEQITSLEEIVVQQTKDLTTLNNNLQELSNKVNSIDVTSYITKSVFELTVGNIEEIQAQEKTLHSQVKELQEALTWSELT